MKIKDLLIKKNDRTPFKPMSMERNPNNNLFLILGKDYFKILELINGNNFEEVKLSFRRIKLIKQAAWGRITNNKIFFCDSNNKLYSSDLNSKPHISDIYEFEDEINHISMNCKDSIMACCTSRDSNIHLLDIENKKIIHTIVRQNPLNIKNCQFSPINENYLIISDDRGHIYLYDKRNTLSQAKDFCSEAKEILSIAWHPTDVNKFCSGGMDNYIRIWDINNNNESWADFKTSEGCSKVSFLKSNPNYIISTHQTNNYNINLWNMKMRDMPEYRFTGHESNVLGFDSDIKGNKIISVEKKGILMIHDLNNGERILDDITTNIIKFNNNNEIYCFHDDKLQREFFSKIIHKDSENNLENKDDIKNNNEYKPLKSDKENIKNIYKLNLNQKDLQMMDRTLKEDNLVLYIKRDIKLTLNSELKQYYIFTPEQIHHIFRKYIYYIEKNENLYKSKRFPSVSDINLLDKITVDDIDFSEKLKISITKNLVFAETGINNYNHISIWKTLLHLVQQNTFKSIFNYFSKEQKKINKKRKNTTINELNKSFEIKNDKYEMNQTSMKLITTLVINQLTKIIDYLIDDYGDIYLATIICYLFKPILFRDEKIKNRVLRLIKDCVSNLRKYQLYVDANHLIKFGPEENNKIEKKSYEFKYSCKNCEKTKFDHGKCSCGRVIACEDCHEVISGLFLWYSSCGHEEHFSHVINENIEKTFCNICNEKKSI